MKWFITDMDGTFLNSNREIAPNSKEVIEKLQKIGSKFIIATGRVDLAVKHYYHNMGLNDVTISCNGGFIRNQKTGEIIYENAFTYEELEYVYDKYVEMNDGSVDILAYTSNYIYSNRISFSLQRIQKAEEKTKEEWKTPFSIQDDIVGAIKERGEKCYKVLLTSKNHDLVQEIHRQINNKFPVEGIFSATDYFDIMPKGSSKANGIKKVAEYYGLDIQDSVVFGDNYNDLDMLKIAGCAVCPANAKDEIKEICHQVIGHHDDFSVIKYIEEYVESHKK